MEGGGEELRGEDNDVRPERTVIGMEWEGWWVSPNNLWFPCRRLMKQSVTCGRAWRGSGS